MSTWVGISSVIGAGSLDGFAVGAMMSGAFFLAVTAPRRARRRQAAAVGAGGALAVGPRGWLSKHASAGRAPRAEGSGAEVLGRGTFGAGTFGADAERVAQPDEPGAQDRAGGAPPSGRDGRIAGGYRSRHRLGDPVPGQTLPGGPSRDGASPGSAPRESARPSSAFPDSAFPDSAWCQVLRGRRAQAVTYRRARFLTGRRVGSRRQMRRSLTSSPTSRFPTGRRVGSRRRMRRSLTSSPTSCFPTGRSGPRSGQRPAACRGMRRRRPVSAAR